MLGNKIGGKENSLTFVVDTMNLIHEYVKHGIQPGVDKYEHGVFPVFDKVIVSTIKTLEETNPNAKLVFVTKNKDGSKFSNNELDKFKSLSLKHGVDIAIAEGDTITKTHSGKGRDDLLAHYLAGNLSSNSYVISQDKFRDFNEIKQNVKPFDIIYISGCKMTRKKLDPKKISKIQQARIYNPSMRWQPI